MSARGTGQHLALEGLSDIRMLNLMQAEMQGALKARLDAGLTIGFISRSLGHRPAFMSRILNTHASSWKYNDWLELSAGALCATKIDFWNLPDCVESPLWEMSKTNPAYRGVGAMELLKKVRLRHGWTHRSLAAEKGVVYSAIRQVEESDNPKLGTICRYAQWVGVRARMRVVRTWRGEMEAWK